MTETDEETARLVKTAQLGDRAAFGAVYMKYARMVHGILLARVASGDVDDIAQDVFLQAWQQLATLRNASAFGSWVAAIARSRAIDHRRRERPTDELPADIAQPVGPADEESHLILAAIRTLPPAYREPIMLRLVEGMTGPEIAARTGLTPASVRVNLCRGMKHLRARLAIGPPALTKAVTHDE